MTYGQKYHEGIDKNVMTPIDKNVLDNNTVFNNTINKLCLESGVNSVMFNKLTSYSDDDDDYEVK